MATCVYGVDPGPESSALVVFDGQKIVAHCRKDNLGLLQDFCDRVRSPSDVLCVEQVASFGMPVGAEVFETVFWSGRFAQAWTGYRMPRMPWGRLKRHHVKTALCGNQRAKDAHVRQALMDRFGPGKDKAVGKKAAPGPLYGLAGDEWSALAVAVVYWDAHMAEATIGVDTHGGTRT